MATLPGPGATVGMVGGGCHTPVRDLPGGGNSCEVRCALKAPPPLSTGVRCGVHRGRGGGGQWGDAVCLGEATGRCGVPRGGNGEVRCREAMG